MKTFVSCPVIKFTHMKKSLSAKTFSYETQMKTRTEGVIKV